MELVVALVVIGGLAAYVVRGHREASAANEDRLAVVQRMQGRHVVARLGTGRLVVEHSGFLRQDGGRVILAGHDGREQVVPLGQIREIEDANGVQGSW